MTKNEAIAAAVETLAETFRVELSAPAARGYLMGLDDLTPAEIAQAAARALRECRFMPSPAELLTLAGRGAARDHAAEAALAWQAVRAAMDSLDVYGNPDFGPLVNAVVRNVGGWLYLCESTLPDLEWRRKGFERVYQMFAEKDPATLDGSPLIGEWRHAPVTPIQIPGQPTRPLALPEKPTPHGDAMRSLVRELAEGKAVK